MHDRLKQRLVGAMVLVLAAVVFVPMFLDQGAGSPEPAPRIVPSEQLEDAGARVVPLGRTPIAAAPAAAEPADRVEPEPAEEKLPAKTLNPPAPAEPAVESGFAVQLGSFAKADNAERLRDKLIGKGYKAFVKSSGAVTRVYVGPQSTRPEADNVLKKLLADIKLKGIVVTFSG